MTETDEQRNSSPRVPDRQRQQWRLRREQILMFFGLCLIAAEFINAEVRGATFHYEFLLGGLALCGISLAQWGDRK